MTEPKLIDIIKKIYTKPTITEVRLVPQEAILNVCKDGADSAECLVFCSAPNQDAGS